MKQHYGLNDVEYNKLINSGISVMDMLKAVPEFAVGDPENANGVSAIAMMYYIDRHGDFTESSRTEVHCKIARAVFASMDSQSKRDIVSYLQWLDEGDSESASE